ncbi:MAG: hypothetical protein RI948_1647 [Bacteroidota bacterium]|jgi:hypothetical protein
MCALTKLPGYLLALVCFFFFACNDPASKKTISLDEIRPQATKQLKQKPKKSPEDTLQRLINFYTNDSTSLQIANIKRDSTADKFFLDRFSVIHQRYLLTDSLGHVFAYKTWTFKDSSSCTEAFYNWLDQAGKNKTSVALKTGNIWSKGHEIYLVSNQEIIQISSTERLLLRNWVKWLSGTPNFEAIKYILHAQPRKKTLWLKYTNSKLSTL